MNFLSLISASTQLSMPRLLLDQAKTVLLVLVIICAAFDLIESDSCVDNGIKGVLDREACDRDSHNAGFTIGSFDDAGTGYLSDSGLVRPTLESICSDINMFCFPSTLPGFTEDGELKLGAMSSLESSQPKSNSSWSADYDVFMLANGKAVSCSTNSHSGSLDELVKSRGPNGVYAKGYGVESPYRVQLLEKPGISPNRRWSRNLSLFNPFDETLSVEEVTVLVSVPLGSCSYLTELVCKLETSENSGKFGVRRSRELWDLKGYQIGMPLMAMRPLKVWDIAPGGSEMIIDLDFLHNTRGNAIGAICVKLVRSSEGKSDTIVVPFDVDLSVELTSHLAGPVLASIEALPNDAGDASIFALSLRNKATYLLNVINIGFGGEGSEHFQIKYLEGLMLFPGSITQVAVISYTPDPDKIRDQLSDSFNMNLNCRLTILTNDSINPQVEIGCKDVVTIPSHSDVYSQFEEHAARIGSSQSRVNSSLLKVVEATEPDELVLQNWKSQATARDVSVLHRDEVIFPVVQVGTHHSEWITVQNPTRHPVLMQLILNTGQIVDDCKDLDEFTEPSSSSLTLGEYALQTKYGFSIGETALTEAYVLPYKSASLGPVVFHPSKRCGWRSSALIRNNLSGVEWVYLQGFGGSFSLGLFEDADLVKNLEFKFSSPSLNLSPDYLYQSEDYHICHRPLVKELFAKNLGDVPLHVRKIKVSGTDCGLDGFSVHDCNGFALQPGESAKLLISYRPDFSTATVQRDLELTLDSGILVIPMKATIPLLMFNLCKKLIFWTRIKRLSCIILFGTGLMLVMFYYIPPISMSRASKDYLIRSPKSSLAIIRQVEKSQNKKTSSKISASSKMSGLVSFVELDQTSVALKQEMKSQQIKPTMEYQGQVDESKDAQEELKDGTLTIKIGKDKRRRRKKKGSVLGLTGISEVSSSHSGNSTPSSPLSPLTSYTPKRIWSAPSEVDRPSDFRKVEQHRAKNLGLESISTEKNLDQGISVKSSEKCTFRAQEKPSPPLKKPGKPVLLQSATFPSRKIPSPLVSTSKLPLHARAPGSKINIPKAVEAQEKTKVNDQFVYDLWGNNLFGSRLIEEARNGSVVTSPVVGNGSDSYFVSAPNIFALPRKVK